MTEAPQLLTTEQKQKLKEKILSGELSSQDPAIKVLIAKTTEHCPLAFAQKFLKEHMTDQDTGELIHSPAFHKEMTDMALSTQYLAIAAPRG
jgi:hypothetical protein